jgi:hypothetical protein
MSFGKDMKEGKMVSQVIKNIDWYSDDNALARGEPGIQHSFMSSLATALNHISGEIDPAWLMGSSAFAFRIIVNETMCPSAMSIFNWSPILSEAGQQSGFQAKYISRLWHESDHESERRAKAHLAIMEGIDTGIPAVVWDIADDEWGLIVGYNTLTRRYKTLTCKGQPSKLPFTRLGMNGIDILSVAIPWSKNERSREEIISTSLRKAVDHAYQKEWTERPNYQDGLQAYDLWALIYDRWSMLVEAGKSSRIGFDLQSHAAYYAAHYYSARCYARDYLTYLAGGESGLKDAASCYQLVTEKLKPLWEYTQNGKSNEITYLIDSAQNIREAKIAETEGIKLIEDYLRTFGS